MSGRFGYVHPEPIGDLDAGEQYVFFGAHPTVNPSEEDILNMSPRQQSEAAANYLFVAGNGGYLFVALPQSFGIVPAFYLGAMATVFIRTSITLPIEGEDVLYYLYRSPEPTNATNLTLTVP